MQDGSPYPVAAVPYTTASNLYSAYLVSAKKITADDAAKCTLQLSFRVEVCQSCCPEGQRDTLPICIY